MEYKDRGELVMTEDKVIFNCEAADLQMKAVAMLVQKASDFRSTVYIVKNGHRANAKSLLGVMSLRSGQFSDRISEGP